MLRLIDGMGDHAKAEDDNAGGRPVVNGCLVTIDVARDDLAELEAFDTLFGPDFDKSYAA
jgi:hypothetical protein